MEDKLYRFLKYYNASPQWLRGLSGRAYRMIPLSVRYGKVYTDHIRLLEKSQWWSREEIETYQWQKLESLLNHAYQNVPYYRRVFDERGLKPADIQSLDDFRRIPFLTKAMVRDNFEDLIAQNYPKSKRLGVTTGGSTGDPLRLVYEKGVSRPRDWAFFHHLWRRVGYTFGDKMAVFEDIVVRASNENRFWAYEPTKNRLLFSIYHMTDRNLPGYIQEVRRFGPKFIHTFPSSLALLARFMKLNGIAPFPSVKAILCASENLRAEQRDLFEEVFGCRVFDCYGQVELVVLSGGCEKQNAHHIFPEYGLTELIGEGGHVVTEEGGVGEIVGTGFGNWLMPLIRYKTGDLAVSTNAQCQCGRAYRLLSRIEGRMQEFFIARGGALIPLLGNYSIAAKMLDKIRELQFVQEQEGTVIVNTVKESTCSESEVKNELLGRLEKRSGGRLDFEVRFVPCIRRTKRGKQKLLVQNLPTNRGKQRSLLGSAFAS
jgi:phenylacetate-coenzyme A ligase PaaK-like adenylate-forming protein